MKQIPITEIKAERTLFISVLRFNPFEPDTKAWVQTYEIEEADSMTLFIALNLIRKEHDPSLQFDFVCRAGICGSCAMLVNGKPSLACRTLTQDLSEQIHLAPLPGFELIGDLSVNTGKWMRGMAEKLETWIHRNEKELDYSALEEKMEPRQAEDIYELERCIECGCCISACATAQMHEDFVGAVAINQMARFYIDPRDKRSNKDYYQVIGDESGVFGCMTLLACEDMCPKDLPLAQQLAYMRRAMVKAAITRSI